MLHAFAAKLAGLRVKLSLLRRGVGLVMHSARGWTILWFVLLIIQGVLPAILLPLTKYIVDAIGEALQAGLTPESLRALVLFGGLFAAVMLAQRIIGMVSSYASTAQGELVQDHVRQLIQTKAAQVDYGFFEYGVFYDMLSRADSQASARIMSLLSNVGMLVSSGITLVSIGVIIASYSLWLPVAIVASVVPLFGTILRHNRIYHEWWQAVTPQQRWAQYFNGLLTSRSSAAELRMLRTGDEYIEQYQTLRKDLREGRLRLLRRQLAATFAGSVGGLAILGAAVVWILNRSLRGAGTLGDLALFYQAFNQGQLLMNSMVGNAGQVLNSALFLDDLFEFLDQKPMLKDPERPVPIPALQEEIAFENVTFTYPGGNHPALENFTLRIPAGKVVAIVGENGAGKSTLSKLLCRFYDPDEGRVTWEGHDLRSFAQEDLRRAISIMFQHPVQYQATVAENIAMGLGASAEQVREAARGAGIEERILRLPNGYDTLLGRLFAEGTELSGGEWQRLALARAFLQPSSLLILDEPTSFMDSWAEQAWLERFRALVQQRTAIIITHRFSAAMQADLIFVMRRGHVVEAGTHEELLRMSGFYAASWEAQHQQADPSPVR